MKPSWIHLARGRYVRQARVGLGELREELFGRKGFSGPTAMLYHTRSPVEMLRIEGPLKPRSVSAYDIVAPDGNDASLLPVPVLTNADVAILISRRTAAMPYAYRNADGDLLYFVHRGTGTMATEFGPLAYEPGDYIYLPRGTIFRHMPDARESFLVVVESPDAIDFAAHPQTGRHFPFDPQLLTIPDVEAYDWPAQDEWELRIKAQGELTSVFYAQSPFDVVGWKGDLFPFKINIRDIHVLTSERLHIAPSSWATFETSGFMVVTFLPQPAVNDLQSEELPSNHRNIDCDEAIFVHAAEHRPPGMLIHSPQGILHGPPDAFRQSFNRNRVHGMRREMTGISVDTYKPLRPAKALLDLTDMSRR